MIKFTNILELRNVLQGETFLIKQTNKQTSLYTSGTQ